jgi:hypothetical protein
VKRLLFSALPILLVPATARAGMPSPRLSDVAEMRIQSISFFALVFLLSAAAVWLIWNRLARDFTSLPRLTYFKSLGVVFLWGLLFVLVLTMISGARELLTPGAWEKKGLTYQLPKDSPPAQQPDSRDAERREKLVQLRTALWEYAQANHNRFPADRDTGSISTERWRVPDPSGMRYVYVPGRTPDEGAEPLAYEPGIFGLQRWVLLTSGEIKQMDVKDIVALLPMRP